MNRTQPVTTKLFTCGFLRGGNAILAGITLAKLVIHLLTSVGYGYFGDELYWLAMGAHLDFGYVDVPPLAAYLSAFSRVLLGDSLLAIHVFPAVAGAAAVYTAGLTARELGGGKPAQWFSALMVLAAPYALFVNSVFTYDGYEQLCAILLFYLTVRIINKETPKRWLVLGLVAGLGALTKLSVIYTGGALAIALLFTSRRKSLLTVWPWLALLAAGLVCTPYLVWQEAHGWPLFTYFKNYALNPARPHQSPGQFFTGLFFYHLNPLLLPVLPAGLVHVLFHRTGKRYRPLGLAFLMLAVLYTVVLKLENRQMVSACFPLLTAGAVRLESLAAAAEAKRKAIRWLRHVYTGLVVITAALMAPINLPILPVSALEDYWAAAPAFIRECDYQPGIIPHHNRFSLDWPEMVREIAAVYQGLPEKDREKCAIWTGFYWDAGAVDLLGKEYALPGAMSNCLSYQTWGTRQLHAGNIPEVAIMFHTAPGFFPAHSYYEEVVRVQPFDISRYSIYTDFKKYTKGSRDYLAIYICRKPKAGFTAAWENNAYSF